jgi:hypothetical protein
VQKRPRRLENAGIFLSLFNNTLIFKYNLQNSLSREYSPADHSALKHRRSAAGCSRVSGSIFDNIVVIFIYTALSNTVLDLFNLNKVASLPVRSCGISEDL